MWLFPDVSMFVWVVLGGLLYVLVTCVLATLAARVGNEVERHELQVQAVKQRHSYRQSVERAKEQANSRKRHRGGGNSSQRAAA